MQDPGRPVAELSGVRGLVNAQLGLHANVPPKPLLWKAGGHPAGPPSAGLAEAAAQLQALCAAATAGNADPAAVAQLIARMQGPAAAADMSDEGALDEAGMRRMAEEKAFIISAALSADWGLRAALTEGLRALHGGRGAPRRPQGLPGAAAGVAGRGCCAGAGCGRDRAADAGQG